MKGKKFLAMILSAALGMSTFAACGRRVVEPEKKTTETEAETETEETENSEEVTEETETENVMKMTFLHSLQKKALCLPAEPVHGILH